MAFSAMASGTLSFQTLTMWSKNTLLHAGKSQGLIPLLLVISASKDLSNTYIWAVLKVEEHKIKWDIAVAWVLWYSSDTAKHPEATIGFQSLALTLSEHHILNHGNMVLKWETPDLMWDME